MAYIQPNSRIEFFDDIGLSQDYNDTLYFPSLSAKDSYFDNIDRLAHVDNCYYARENRGFVRVELPMNTMIHAQYMRFKNTSYENKWWYAFVTDVIYINNNTTEVQFELDPMMTWMGEFNLAQCYVERQHSLTDAIGDNIVEEPVNCGTYVANSMEGTNLFNDWVYIVFFSPNVLSLIAETDINDDLGIYSGLSAIIFPDDGTATTKLNVYRLVQLFFGQVQMVEYVPDAFIPYLENVDGFDDPNERSTPPVIKVFSLTESDMYDGIDGIPAVNIKNNKLYTYPYNALEVINTEGDAHTYKFEFFDKNQTETFDFALISSVNEKTSIGLFPYAYKGQNVNEEEVLYMRDFPYCAWASDAFMAYLAQTLSSNPVQRLSEAKPPDGYDKEIMNRTFTDGNKLKQLFSADTAKGLASVAGGAMIAGDIGKILMTPADVSGGSSPDVMTLRKRKNFWFIRKTINAQNARIIDDFFTMFGYAQKRVMQPNMNARQFFTYVKTIDCKINCRCPASDADFIEGLFNKGIRFWKNHSDIGNYSLNNAPLV